MKILYLDLYLHNHNPQVMQTLFLFRRVSKVFTYGLGYQPQKVLEKGVRSFYEKFGPFDFIVTNEHILFSSQSKNFEFLKKVYKRNYYFQFNIQNLENYLIDMFMFFKEVDNKKIIELFDSDYYNFRIAQIDILKSINAHIIGWVEDMIAPIDKLNDLSKESFFKKANDNWYNFVVSEKHRIISLPYFVNDSEFYFEALSNRKNIIKVAGVNYYHRKKVLDVLKTSKYKTNNKKIYNKIYSIMRKIGIKPDSHPVLMRLYNILFRSEIEQSRYIFTCGSGLEWPIRKFFEIPALGSLLLAKPFYNAQNLGFVDGENYIKTNYKDIIEKIDFLEHNLDKAQMIAKNGQDIVWNTHSLSARAEQLKKCFNSILNNNFKGTYWKDGEFYVK